VPEIKFFHKSEEIFHTLAILTIGVTLHARVVFVRPTVDGVGDSPAFVGTAVQTVFVSFTVEHGPPYFTRPLVFVGIVVSVPRAEAKHSTENFRVPLIPVTVADRAPLPTDQHLHSSETEISSLHSVTYTCKQTSLQMSQIVY
jgi:hypothetical protein